MWNEVNVPKWFIPAKSVIVSYAALPVGLAIRSPRRCCLFGSYDIMAMEFDDGGANCILIRRWILPLVLTVIILDIQFLLQYATIILLIVTPIAYTVSMVPEKLLVAMAFNPLYHYVTCYQYSIPLIKCRLWKTSSEQLFRG